MERTLKEMDACPLLKHADDSTDFIKKTSDTFELSNENTALFLSFFLSEYFKIDGITSVASDRAFFLGR